MKRFLTVGAALSLSFASGDKMATAFKAALGVPGKPAKATAAEH